jgi:DNA invertase Pin-like site-specific DNA recombinase
MPGAPSKDKLVHKPVFFHLCHGSPEIVGKPHKRCCKMYGAETYNVSGLCTMKIGYARVSTDDQETHLQIDALKQVKCGRIYQEKASRAKADRPELMKLLDNARKGDVVIVWKLDRLARSIRQLLDTTALLSERGVELYSLTENINTTTPTGKLTFHIFAALAEFERDILRQRVNAGLKAARRRGCLGGRPKSLTEADLKKARALLRSGDYTKGQVADELKVNRLAAKTRRGCIERFKQMPKVDALECVLEQILR